MTEIMSTMELEVQKASLAREILTTTDEAMINDIWLLIQNYKPVGYKENDLTHAEFVEKCNAEIDEICKEYGVLQ
jgi:hypothetical protein